MQSVHAGNEDLDHLPAAHVAHAMVESGVALPASHGVHDVPPAVVSVSVMDPGAHIAHADKKKPCWH